MSRFVCTHKLTTDVQSFSNACSIQRPSAPPVASTPLLSECLPVLLSPRPLPLLRQRPLGIPTSEPLPFDPTHTRLHPHLSVLPMHPFHRRTHRRRILLLVSSVKDGLQLKLAVSGVEVWGSADFKETV